METPIAEGERIHFNFAKPHLALLGMTSAQRAGIKNDVTWFSLLQRAVREK